MLRPSSLVLTVVVMKCSVFWDITTCSPLKVNHALEEHVSSISGSVYSFNLMQVTCSSETSVDFQRTMRHDIPEERTQYEFC
jgi:hypothetical protein